MQGILRPLWRRRFAGTERDSRVSQVDRNALCGRVRTTEHAPRGPFDLLERRHCLADIVEGGAGVLVTAGRGLIPRRGDWLPGTPWDMSDLAPLSVAERCEPAPEDATFTHVCG